MPRPTLQDRLFSRLIVDPSGCLLWTAKLNNQGYGLISVNDRLTLVHRVMYELFVGPIPDGLQLDHLCCVRRCASPAHLEAVTRQENQRRAAALSRWTHCGRGHEYTEANTYVRRDGTRECHACQRFRYHTRYKRALTAGGAS